MTFSLVFDRSFTPAFSVALGLQSGSPLSITAPSFSILTTAQPHDFSAANSNEVTAADADAGGGDFTFTIDATGDGTPTITLATTTGLTFTTGDGTADASMEFDCTVAEFNAAMDGATLQGGTDGSVSIAYSMTDGTNTANRTQIATLNASAFTPSLEFNDARNSQYISLVA